MFCRFIACGYKDIADEHIEIFANTLNQEFKWGPYVAVLLQKLEQLRKHEHKSGCDMFRNIKYLADGLNCVGDIGRLAGVAQCIGLIYRSWGPGFVFVMQIMPVE